MMTSKKKVAQIVVEVLAEAGVKHCYGIVGDTLNYVTNAINKSKIEWIHVRHEEVAGFAAGAEAYITGQVTACAGSCGPGSLHFINSIYEANRNGAPVVLLASQLATSQLGTGFPQEVDFEKIYESCSVFCQQLNDPSQVRRVTTAAVQAAINKKGVAVLILPVDVSETEVEDIIPFKVYHPNPIIRPSDTELADIADLLNRSKNITIYAGQGAHDAHEQLILLASKLQAPIAHTSRAKDFVEYDNVYNVGMTGVFGVESGYHAVKECDTLLVLGADFAWPQFYPDSADIIQIDLDATQLGHRHPITIGAVGSIKPTIEALLPLLKQRDNVAFLDHCRSLYTKAFTKLNQKAVPSKNTIHPQYVTELIDKLANNDAILCADCGSAMVWACRHFNTNGQRRTMVSLKHGTMANAMPQALGLQKAFPNRQIISLSGDGGLTMLLGDLFTAIQENLPIKIVVLNNGSLNFVELEQKVGGLVDHYTDLFNPDLASVAKSIGFYARQIVDAQELESAMIELLAHSGPALLDVKTSSNELVMPPQIEGSQVFGMVTYGIKATLSGQGNKVANLLMDNFIKK